MEEQLSVPPRLVVPPVAALVGRDRGADEPGLTALDPGVGVAQVDLAAADALDLRAREDEARLERVVDVVLVTGLAVEGDRLFRQGNGSLEAANGAGAGERRGRRSKRAGRTNAGPFCGAGVSVALPPGGGA
jgi:hypothetical protein